MPDQGRTACRFPPRAFALVLAVALLWGGGVAAAEPAARPASPPPPAAPPVPAPQWVGAAARGGKVVLTWIRDPRFAAVRVFRSTADAKGVFVPIGEARENTFTDGTVEPGVAYRYRLAAVGSDGTMGRNSAELTVRVGAAERMLPVAPVWEGHIAVENGIGLKWRAQDGADVVVYNVYRRTPPETEFRLIGSSRSASFVDTGAAPGRPQVYALTALDSSLRETPFSEELHAVFTPARPPEGKKTVPEWRPRRTRLVAMTTGGTRQLLRPADVAVGPLTGDVYLSDSGLNLILVFDARGTFLRTIDGAAGTLVSFRRLLGLTVDRGETIYAVDAGQGTVLALTGSGDAGRVVELPQPAHRYPPGLVDCAVGKDGRLFVVDNTNNRVLMAVPGRAADAIGATGYKPGQFSAPTFGAVDADGNFYVADSLNARIQVFSPEGAFVRAFGRPERGPAVMGRPKGVAVHENGEIYVADSWLNSVRVFDRAGQPRAILVDEDGGPLDLGSPNGIALGAGNRIYIAERLSGRLQIRELLDETP